MSEILPELLVAELFHEHSVPAKCVGQRLSQCSIQIDLWIEQGSPYVFGN